MFYFQAIFASIVATILSLPFTLLTPPAIPMVFILAMILFILDDIRQNTEVK